MGFGSWWHWIITLVVILPTYGIPSIVAFVTSHRHRWAIFALNVFTGWTFIGWVAALVWSLVPSRSPAKEFS